MKGYLTIQEWEEDFSRFKKSSNDKHLLEHIKKRINASNKDIQDDIIRELRNIGLQDGKDYEVLKDISNENPNLTIICKSKDDIWFSC